MWTARLSVAGLTLVAIVAFGAQSAPPARPAPVILTQSQAAALADAKAACAAASALSDIRLELSGLADAEPYANKYDSVVYTARACADVAEEAAHVASLLEMLGRMSCTEDSRTARFAALPWLGAGALKAEATTATLAETKATTTSAAIGVACDRALALTTGLTKALSAAREALK
jgi:hypothetical protein